MSLVNLYQENRLRSLRIVSLSVARHSYARAWRFWEEQGRRAVAEELEERRRTADELAEQRK
jgi:hypothetical protein